MANGNLKGGMRTPVRAWCAGLVVLLPLSVAPEVAMSIPASATGNWSVSTTFPNVVSGLVAVSCPTKQVCEVVGGIDSTSAIIRTDDGGQSWQQQATPSGLSLQGVACTTASDCIAVGRVVASSAAAILTTTDGGEDWTEASTVGPLLDAVSCGSPHFCVAVGSGIQISTNGGATWTPEPVPPAVWYFAGVACTSSSSCVAVGENDSNNPSAISAYDNRPG